MLEKRNHSKHLDKHRATQTLQQNTISTRQKIKRKVHAYQSKDTANFKHCGEMYTGNDKCGETTTIILHVFQWLPPESIEIL